MRSTRLCECVDYNCRHWRTREFRDPKTGRVVSEAEAVLGRQILSGVVIRCKAQLGEAEDQYCSVCLEFVRRYPK